MLKKFGIFFILTFSFISQSKVNADFPKDMTGPMTMEQQEYFLYGEAYRLGYTLCYLEMNTEVPFGDLINMKNFSFEAVDFPENSRFRRIRSAGYDEGVDLWTKGSKFHECHILKNKT